MRTERWIALSFVSAVALSLAGCPGDLEDPERFGDGGASAACTDAPKDVFAKSCVSGCHSTSSAASSGDLDLEASGIVARLKDKKAKGGAGMLIDSSNVDQSVMLTKLKTPPPFGAKMPFGSAALSDAQIQCVKDWIVSELKSTGGSDAGADSGGGGSDAAADAAKD